MKLKKIAALICAAAMVTLCAAGCGGGSSDDKTEDVQKKSEPVEVTEYDSQAIENAGDITLTLMMSGTEVENDFDTEVLPKLVKEKWPNVTLEVTKLPDDNYYTALKTKLASGECPDMILVQPNASHLSGGRSPVHPF